VTVCIPSRRLSQGEASFAKVVLRQLAAAPKKSPQQIRESTLQPKSQGDDRMKVRATFFPD
jgi:hypothetical protein